MKYFIRIVSCAVFLFLFPAGCREKGAGGTGSMEKLGKALFFDASLSRPVGQSCATCHRPERGFADTLARPVSEGAVKGLFSFRHSMTICYSCYVPPLHYNTSDSVWTGGLFWDGRMNTLEQQAAEPFIDPLEMAADRAWVAGQVRKSPYFAELTRLFGCTENTDSLYAYVAKALSAYERSAEVNRFSSRFDAFQEGRGQLTAAEQRGYELFRGKGMCAECHITEPDAIAGKVLFTDHTYDNLGIPANTANPFYDLPAPYNNRGRDTIDLGLGGFLGDSLEYGKFRVPTLRNIELTAPYGHNGYFRTLEDIVHFYNVRDAGVEYPRAEYPLTVNRDELGDLKLTAAEEADIVAFLKTLTDSRK